MADVQSALSYLNRVKLAYNDDSNQYRRFLEVMKQYKLGEIDMRGVINSIVLLFPGRTDLVLGFRSFLPPGYGIEVDPGDPATYVVSYPDGDEARITVQQD